MTSEKDSRRRWIEVSVGEFVVIAALLGAVLVQHLRHGWPFSLHHGFPTNTSAGSLDRQRAAAHAQHAASGATEGDVDMDGGVAPPPPPGIVPDRTAVALEPARQELIGIRLATVTHASLAEPIRAVATIAPDESRVSHVHTRVSGWIERLYVRTTGAPVRAGQALAAIFSPELVASQTEFLGARSAATRLGPAMQEPLLAAARQRLRVLGMNEGEIASVERTGHAIRTVTVSAPRSGVVVHRGIAVGTAVDPSTEILTVMDLSRVWVFVEVAERDIPLVRVGARVSLSFPAVGTEPVEAPVEFLYPTLTDRTRTLRARLALANPTGNFRPGLYGSAEIRVGERHGLIVARDAVVDTGIEQHVFVVAPDGSFVPRRVTTGVSMGDSVEIREGLVDGERIVASGVFLLDSESRLRASGGAGMAHAGHGGASSSGSGTAGGHAGHSSMPVPAAGAPDAAHGTTP